MRTRISIFAAIAFAAIINAQNLVDMPYTLQKDTVYTRTRVTHDLYFTSTGAYGIERVQFGPLDLHIYALLASHWTVSGSDTLTVEAYGIVKRSRSGVTSMETHYVDSTRISAAVYADTVFHVIPIDPLYSNLPLYDGIRLVFKKGGSDLDSVDVYSGFRAIPLGVKR